MPRLSKFLTKYGWKYALKGTTYHSGWVGKFGFYSMNIFLSKSFCRFEVKLAIHHQLLKTLSFQELYEYLIGLNDELKVVKLLLCKETFKLILVVDVFLEDLTFKQFRNTVEVLGYYSDHVTEEMSHLFLRKAEVKEAH